MPRREELSFRAGDVSLSGTLTLPDAEGSHPWVVAVPSWLPRNRDGSWDRSGHPAWFAPMAADPPPGLLARLADALASNGVACLRYDPRGCGASAGTWTTSDLFTRIDDARDAVGAMRSRSELDLRRTAIVGHGEGAGIALSVAIGDPAIGAVGLVGASARSLRDVLRRGVAERSRTGRDREHPFVSALDTGAEELIERVGRGQPTMTMRVPDGNVDLALAGWEQGFNTPPLALASMLHRSVVLAHGREDAWADPDESRILAAVLESSGNDPLLQVVDGAGHNLAEADGAIGKFADELVARIGVRDLPAVLLAIEEMR